MNESEYSVWKTPRGEIGVAKQIAPTGETNWEVELNLRDPNDLEIWTKCLALWKVGRAEQGNALVKSYMKRKLAK